MVFSNTPKSLPSLVNFLVLRSSQSYPVHRRKRVPITSSSAVPRPLLMAHSIVGYFFLHRLNVHLAIDIFFAICSYVRPLAAHSVSLAGLFRSLLSLCHAIIWAFFVPPCVTILPLPFHSPARCGEMRCGYPGPVYNSLADQSFSLDCLIKRALMYCVVMHNSRSPSLCTCVYVSLYIINYAVIRPPFYPVYCL